MKGGINVSVGLRMMVQLGVMMVVLGAGSRSAKAAATTAPA